MNPMRRMFGLALLVSATYLSLPNGEARACFNATQKELDQETKIVIAAEAALLDDQLAVARAKVKHTRAYSLFRPEIREPPRAPYPEYAKITFLARRAHRVDALAIIRDPASTPEERERATSMLIYLARASSDLTLAIDVAEAMATSPEREPVALMMLRTPADKDLIGSAHAYAALARMERARGNTAAAATAEERCTRQAKHPQICR